MTRVKNRVVLFLRESTQLEAVQIRKQLELTNIEDDLTETKTEIEFSVTRIESTTMDVTYRMMYLSTIIHKGKTNRKFVKISLKLRLI